MPPPPPDTLFGESVIDGEKETPKAKKKEESVSKNKITEPLTKELLSKFGIKRYTDSVYQALVELGIETVGLIPTLTIDELISIKGVGEKTAKKLRDNAVNYYK